MQQALLCALAYMFTVTIDGFLAGQVLNRPIVMGAIVGAFCGDVKTGVIMGAQLEAIYMGISPIGGVVSSNYRVATTVGVGLVIFTGINLEAGVAIATTIGALVNSLQALQKAILASIHPFIIRFIDRGDYRGYKIAIWLQYIFVSSAFNALIVFLAMALGAETVQLFLDKVPAFVMTGLGVAGNVLVVIGLALTTQAIWMKNAFFYVLMGFVLHRYIGLAILPIAAVGIIVAVLTFTRDMELKTLKESFATAGASSGSKEGDDFYG